MYDFRFTIRFKDNNKSEELLKLSFHDNNKGVVSSHMVLCLSKSFDSFKWINHSSSRLYVLIP